jgi:ActR/RegA family two-component response regulator
MLRYKRVVLMTQLKPGVPHRVLLVDDDEAVRFMMSTTLERKGFEVVSAANVTEALKLIILQTFDVLITDLHMPNPSDGFAVITAMRHTQPNALTLLVSGYPDVKGAMNAILLEADDIIVKPFDASTLADLVHAKLSTRTLAVVNSKQRVAAILERCATSIVDDWLVRVQKSTHLSQGVLTNEERTGYLPKLIEDLVARLRTSTSPGEEGESLCSEAAVAHGKMRQLQGYSAGMLVHDSRMLQVTLFGTLQKNLGALDFSLLLPDIMTIADEVDSQLTQAMDSFMSVVRAPAAA